MGGGGCRIGARLSIIVIILILSHSFSLTGICSMEIYNSTYINLLYPFVLVVIV